MRPSGLEQQLQYIKKLRQECNISVQLHYPKVFDDSSGNKQEDLGDQEENFIDFEQRLDWTYGDGRA
jgi:hypothetical protein